MSRLRQSTKRQQLQWERDRDQLAAQHSATLAKLNKLEHDYEELKADHNSLQKTLSNFRPKSDKLEKRSKVV